MLVAWNPLIIFETSANGHNDAVMMLFALLGLLSVASGELVLGPVLLVASALVKYATGLLIPLLLVYGAARQPTWRQRCLYLAVVCLFGLAVAAAAYLPFWRGPDTFQRSLLENQLYVASFPSVLSDLLNEAITPNRATTLGRILFLPIYAYALWLSRRGVTDLLRACFVALFGFLALGVTNFKIWYAVWPSMLAAGLPRLSERIAALLLGWAATLSAAYYGYIWVWLGLTTPGAFTLVNTLAYVLDFLPAALVLLALPRWKPGMIRMEEQRENRPPADASREVS
jgi:hypothetical protein